MTLRIGSGGGAAPQRAERTISVPSEVTSCFTRSDRTALLVLSAAWILCALIINPVAEFPLNDDWSYSRSVESLLATGTARIADWNAMSTVGQVLWGALFCLPFGFSFTALRFSTLVLGLAGAVAVYFFARHRGVSPTAALITALAVAGCPLYVMLAHSFMTDVPFFAISTFATLFFARAISGGSRWNMLAAIALATWATLIRQLGLCLPLAFLLTVLLLGGDRKRLLPWALLSAAAPLVALWLYQSWMAVPSTYAGANAHLVDSILHHPLSTVRHMVRITAVMLCYLGLFSAPWWITRWGKRLGGLARVQKWRDIVMLGGLSLSAAMAIRLLQGRVPLEGNYLNSFGLGPALLRDEMLGVAALRPWPEWVWLAALILGCAGALFVLRESATAAIDLHSSFRHRCVTDRQRETAFLFMAALLYILPVSTIGFVDRYALPLLLLIPLALTCGSIIFSRRLATVGLFLGAVYCLIGALGTHDYLAWNRARWRALNDLTDVQQISPNQIDGGFEFNGWHRGWLLYDTEDAIDLTKPWWWVEDDLYVVSFGPVPGYETVRTVAYRKWLPPSTEQLHVLKRSG